MSQFCRFTIPRQGLQGEGYTDQPAFFMKNLPYQSCLKSQTSLSSFFAAGTQADPAYYTNIVLQNGPLGPFTFWIRHVYASDRTLIGAYQTLSNTSLLTPTANTMTASICSCSNMITEAYNYLQINNSIPAYYIDAFADLLVTNIMYFDCSNNATLLYQQKSSLTFFENLSEIKILCYQIGEQLTVAAQLTNSFGNATTPPSFLTPIIFNLVNVLEQCQSIIMMLTIIFGLLTCVSMLHLVAVLHLLYRN